MFLREGLPRSRETFVMPDYVERGSRVEIPGKPLVESPDLGGRRHAGGQEGVIIRERDTVVFAPSFLFLFTQ